MSTFFQGNLNSLVFVLKEMERLENQPCEWDDHMLAQALESEQRREFEEHRQQQEEEFKKLQVWI